MTVKMTVALDTRRAKLKSDVFPVILLVRIGKNPYRYPTIFQLPEADFEKLSAPRLAAALQEIKDKLRLIQRKADEYLENCSTFDRIDFENDFICGNPMFKARKKKLKAVQISDGDDFDYTPYLSRFPIFKEDHSIPGCISAVFFIYIKKLLQEERIGSALNYQDTYNSLKKFKGNVTFDKITVSYLNQYEQMMRAKGRTKATIGIKLRPLRTIFNEAIEMKIIKRENCYPFGRRKYIIPTGRNIKKALPLVDLNMLYNYTPESEEEKKAKLYWFFCYYGNGMNTKDVAYLRYKNIDDGFIVFTRAKIERTTKDDPKLIMVYISEEIQKIIDEIGNKRVDGNTFLFPILDDRLDPLAQHLRIKAFTKFVNDGMKGICQKAGVDRKSTTNVARHSLATVLKRQGASTEFIQETLGHYEKRTTENYMDSFDTDMKKDFAERLNVFKKLNNESTMQQ
ncbi:MAG: site-specific integrase [Chitinophagales bacterium]|nr:site-specific integrase [Chitinophagales bacterium]